MLISVHMPKTAGTSFSASLRQHFGAGLLLDYYDVPINTPPLLRRLNALSVAWRTRGRAMPEAGCIHGHFMPLKYLQLRRRCDIRFITWLRDPVERVVSHYHGWMRNLNPAGVARLHRRVLDEGWSLERFCLSVEVRDLYSEFLWGFSPERFAFIGITEFYEEDFARFSRQFLGAGLETMRLNVGARREARYPLEPSFRAAVEKFHAKDVRLYRWALNRRLCAVAA